MDYEIVSIKEKKIVGLSAHTSNSSPNMQSVIGTLWNRFFSEGIFQKIENKVGFTTIGLYSDYSNGNQDYNITVGCEVSNTDNIPTGTVEKIIPGGKYAKFIVIGDVKEAVGEFWERFQKTTIERTFTGDFEEYIADENGNCNQIHIYIAIK